MGASTARRIRRQRVSSLRARRRLAQFETTQRRGSGSSPRYNPTSQAPLGERDVDDYTKGSLD